MTDITLPPGMSRAMSRRVFIPAYPHDPSQGGEWYNIDLNPILTPTDDTMDELLMKVPAWYATLRWYAFLSRIVSNNIKRIILNELKRNSHETVQFIERYVLPGNYDYVYWKEQSEWLDGAVSTIEKSLIPLLQTANANRRAEATPAYNPPQH